LKIKLFIKINKLTLLKNSTGMAAFSGRHGKRCLPMVKHGGNTHVYHCFVYIFQENKMAAYAGKHGENVVANIIAEAQGSKASGIVLWCCTRSSRLQEIFQPQ
jgi:hypothetical protein